MWCVIAFLDSALEYIEQLTSSALCLYECILGCCAAWFMSYSSVFS